MKYYAYNIELQPRDPWVEVFLGLLENENFNTVEESHQGLIAYSDEKWPNERKGELLALLKAMNPEVSIAVSEEIIPWKNWNEEWEKGFEPIFIDDWCAVYAPFHEITKSYPVQIIINPKMSFGTGHHQTTALMLQMLKQLPIKGKDILDMGCGTGILAIAAKILGAKEVDAVDIESWSVENTIENAQLNNQEIRVEVADTVPQKKYDILLANINKNVLIDQSHDYCQSLVDGGDLFLSGILSTDFDEVKEHFVQLDLSFKKQLKKDNWICLHFCKKA